MEEEKQLMQDLKKIHSLDENKKKSKEYYRAYYRLNKDRYKKRYQENKSQILGKMKETRQNKRKKGRGIFTIRHLKNETISFSPMNESNPGQQNAK